MSSVSRILKCQLILGVVIGATWGCDGDVTKPNNSTAGTRGLVAKGGKTSVSSEAGGADSLAGSASTSGGASDASSAAAGSVNCDTGSVGCACYGNATCDVGLVCVSSLCVTQNAGGATNAGGGTSSVIGAGGTGGISDAPATNGGTVSIGTSGGGAVGTGGTLILGGGTSGGGTGSAAGAGSACAEPSLYCPCSTLGALGCLGHAQRVQLLCDGTHWIANGTCSSTTLCDTAPGPNQGLCATPTSSCNGRSSNESFCSGTTKTTCGPDLLTVTSKTCPYLCVGNDCVGACTPNATGCLDNLTATCDANGAWQPVSACLHDCVLGTCCGAATPNACGSSCVDLQTNNSNCGACGQACTNGRTCQAGVCNCPPGQTDCGACVNLQTNKANCSACGNACPGAQTCSGGTCGMFNLIANGDFSSGTTNWTLSSYSGASIAMSGSALCVNLTGYGYGTLGWGDATLSTPLTVGTSYRFSYTAYVTTGTLYNFTAKVGHSVSPYTADFTTSTDLPGATQTPFSHTFTQTVTETGAGIGFSFTANTSTATLCFQDVVLVAN